MSLDRLCTLALRYRDALHAFHAAPSFSTYAAAMERRAAFRAAKGSK